MMNTDLLDNESRSDILRELARLAIVEVGELRGKLSELSKAQPDLEQTRLAYEDRLTRLQKKRIQGNSTALVAIPGGPILRG